MRSKREIEIALDKLEYQYSIHPSKKLSLILDEISNYYKAPILLIPNSRWLHSYSNIYIDWMNGKRNIISRILKRIKI